MATCSFFAASLIYSGFSGSFQNVDAVSMSNPEVEKCR